MMLLDPWLFRLLEMSLTGSFVILLILPIRLLMKRVPKVFSFVLWGVVFVRLLCPVSIRSDLSMVRLIAPPHTEELRPLRPSQDAAGQPQGGMTSAESEIRTNETTSGLPAAPENHTVSGSWFSVLWALGAGGVFFHSLFRLFRFRRWLVGAVPFKENSYLADHLQTPVILGILRPKIYLPSSLREGEREYILAHEQYHIHRGDPIYKSLAFLALCLHWFNPLVWLAFGLFVQDMEMSCDEGVLGTMGAPARADYARSLLRLTVGGELASGIPLSFSSGNLKERVTNVMTYQKRSPVFLAVITILVCLLSGCLVTDPSGSDDPENDQSAQLTLLNGFSFQNLSLKDEVVAEETVVLSEEGGEVQYSCTYTRPTVDLRFGLRGEDGAEYCCDAAGGSARGSFSNLPAGTYQMFVRPGREDTNLSDDPQNPEGCRVTGAVNFYLVEETVSSQGVGGSCAAVGYPNATTELNPIPWTFSRMDVPALTDALDHSGVLALYMDQDVTLRVTADCVIEISLDGGSTWSTGTYDTVNWEDFSVWLWEHEPLPNFSMSELQERLKNGAEVRHMILKEGQEIYFVLDDSGALLELVQQEKIQALLLDGQRLVLTSSSSNPFLCSQEMFDSFGDLLSACGVMNGREEEEEWSGVMEHLTENGAAF